jgi:DNA modification methylase
VIRKRLAEGSKGRTSYDLLRFLDLIEIQDGLIDVLDIDLLKNNSKDRLRNLKSKFHPMTPEELKKKDHPCQLPLGLLELFVKVSSNKGDVVFDPFAGTFTTSVAAGKFGRHSVGVELNKKFADFGKRRIKML